MAHPALCARSDSQGGAYIPFLRLKLQRLDLARHLAEAWKWTT
jgi:hypothetical protein